jgi:hypothetical protein
MSSCCAAGLEIVQGSPVLRYLVPTKEPKSPFYPENGAGKRTCFRNTFHSSQEAHTQPPAWQEPANIIMVKAAVLLSAKACNSWSLGWIMLLTLLRRHKTQHICPRLALFQTRGEGGGATGACNMGRDQDPWRIC